MKQAERRAGQGFDSLHLQIRGDVMVSTVW